MLTVQVGGAVASVLVRALQSSTAQGMQLPPSASQLLASLMRHLDSTPPPPTRPPPSPDGGVPGEILQANTPELGLPQLLAACRSAPLGSAGAGASVQLLLSWLLSHSGAKNAWVDTLSQLTGLPLGRASEESTSDETATAHVELGAEQGLRVAFVLAAQASKLPAPPAACSAAFDLTLAALSEPTFLTAATSDSLITLATQSPAALDDLSCWHPGLALMAIMLGASPAAKPLVSEPAAAASLATCGALLQLAVGGLQSSQDTPLSTAAGEAAGGDEGAGKGAEHVLPACSAAMVLHAVLQAGRQAPTAAVGILQLPAVGGRQLSGVAPEELAQAVSAIAELAWAAESARAHTRGGSDGAAGEPAKAYMQHGSVRAAVRANQQQQRALARAGCESDEDGGSSSEVADSSEGETEELSLEEAAAPGSVPELPRGAQPLLLVLAEHVWQQGALLQNPAVAKLCGAQGSHALLQGLAHSALSGLPSKVATSQAGLALHQVAHRLQQVRKLLTPFGRLTSLSVLLINNNNTCTVLSCPAVPRTALRYLAYSASISQPR